MTTPAPRQRGLDAFFAILRDKHGLNAAITRHPAGKARLAAQREERRAREAAEARFGRLTEPTDHHHPRPRTGVRA